MSDGADYTDLDRVDGAARQQRADALHLVKAEHATAVSKLIIADRDRLAGLLAAATEIVDEQADIIAELRARLAGYEPPTLMGSSVNGPLAGRTRIDVARVFLQTVAGTAWRQVARHAKAAERDGAKLTDDQRGYVDLLDAVDRFGAKTVVLSFKGGTAAAVKAIVGSLVAEGITVHATFAHEPEDGWRQGGSRQRVIDESGGGQLDRRSKAERAADVTEFHTRWKEYAPAITAAGGIPTLILMRWTLEPNSGRDWHDWFVPDVGIQALFFDSYNLGNKKRRYTTPAIQLDPIIAAAAEVGLPWGIGETGAADFGTVDGQTRPGWARDTRAYATERDGQVLCWWDQDGGLDYRFDEATAAAWFD